MIFMLCILLAQDVRGVGTGFPWEETVAHRNPEPLLPAHRASCSHSVSHLLRLPSENTTLLRPGVPFGEKCGPLFCDVTGVWALSPRGTRISGLGLMGLATYLWAGVISKRLWARLGHLSSSWVFCGCQSPLSVAHPGVLGC